MKSIIRNRRYLVYWVLSLFVSCTYFFVLRGVIPFPRSLTLGIIEIRVYSICILSGILFVAWQFDKNKYLYKDLRRLDVIDFLFWVILPGIIGARVWHVATDFYLYKDNLFEILYIWNGGLGIFGGMIGGLLGLYLYTKIKKIDFVKVLTLLSVFLPLGQVIGRFGNLANKELLGQETKLPWGMYIKVFNKSYHPSFLYEQIGNLILFLILFFLFKKYGLLKELAYVYLLGYGTVRLIVDIFRTENKVWGNMTVAQIVSLFLIFISGLLLLVNKHYLLYKHKK